MLYCRLLSDFQKENSLSRVEARERRTVPAGYGPVTVAVGGFWRQAETYSNAGSDSCLNQIHCFADRSSQEYLCLIRANVAVLLNCLMSQLDLNGISMESPDVDIILEQILKGKITGFVYELNIILFFFSFVFVYVALFNHEQQCETKSVHCNASEVS